MSVKVMATFLTMHTTSPTKSASFTENDGIFLTEILPRRRDQAFQIVASLS